MKNLTKHKKRTRTPLLAILVAVGIALGSFFVYFENVNGADDILILDFINGKIVLDAEDRELLKQQVIDTTLANDLVQALIAEQHFTTHVTLVKAIQKIEELVANDSSRRIRIEFDYTAIVTLIFEDGSGYYIPVNWEHWTVGEPEYSEQVSLPDPTIRIGPPTTRDQKGTG
jgi:hypothetical protein